MCLHYKSLIREKYKIDIINRMPYWVKTDMSTLLMLLVISDPYLKPWSSMILELCQDLTNLNRRSLNLGLLLGGFRVHLDSSLGILLGGFRQYSKTKKQLKVLEKI